MKSRKTLLYVSLIAFLAALVLLVAIVSPARASEPEFIYVTDSGTVLWNAAHTSGVWLPAGTVLYVFVAGPISPPVYVVAVRNCGEPLTGYIWNWPQAHAVENDPCE